MLILHSSPYSTKRDCAASYKNHTSTAVFYVWDKLYQTVHSLSFSLSLQHGFQDDHVNGDLSSPSKVPKVHAHVTTLDFSLSPLNCELLFGLLSGRGRGISEKKFGLNVCI